MGLTIQIASKYPEISVIPFNASALPGASSTRELSLMIADQAGSSTIEELEEISGEFLSKVNKRPEIERAFTAFNTETPGFKYKIDRDKIAKLGIPLNDALGTL